MCLARSFLVKKPFRCGGRDWTFGERVTSEQLVIPDRVLGYMQEADMLQWIGYVCPDCGLEFAIPEALKLHMKQSGHYMKDDDGNLLCPKCGKPFADHRALAVHITKIHGGDQ